MILGTLAEEGVRSLQIKDPRRVSGARLSLEQGPSKGSSLWGHSLQSCAAPRGLGVSVPGFSSTLTVF